jgi:hypothetical protein
MLGVPALKKVAREIARWPAELGEAIRCNELEQAAAALARVAEAEAAAFTELSRMVGITSQ